MNSKHGGGSRQGSRSGSRQASSREYSAETVKVYVRVRPMLDHELKMDGGSSKAVTCSANGRTVGVDLPVSEGGGIERRPSVMMTQESHLLRPSSKHSSSSGGPSLVRKGFDFDGVFPVGTTQESVFAGSRLPDMIQKVFEGYNGTVFAYGQTGSGKTYTMSGIEEKIADKRHRSTETDSGIVPRSLRYILDHRARLENENSDISFKLRTSFCEIYNETVKDLLNLDNEDLMVRQRPKQGFYVDNLMCLDVGSVQDMVSVAAEGHKNRSVASHKLNMDSSRSHSIFTVYIDAVSTKGKIIRSGKMNFVDLAGSENLKQSESSGLNMKETNAINKSLFTLGSVISTLGDISLGKTPSKTHVPFRDSILTKLLMDALGGSSLTLMIACVSPSALNSTESERTLTYAARASNIKTRPVTNVNQKDDQIHSLRLQLKKFRLYTDVLRQTLSSRGISVPEPPQGLQFPSSSNAGFSAQQYSRAAMQLPRMTSNHTQSEVELENAMLRSKIENLENAFMQRTPSRHSVQSSPTHNNHGLRVQVTNHSLPRTPTANLLSPEHGRRGLPRHMQRAVQHPPINLPSPSRLGIKKPQDTLDRQIAALERETSALSGRGEQRQNTNGSGSHFSSSHHHSSRRQAQQSSTTHLY